MKEKFQIVSIEKTLEHYVDSPFGAYLRSSTGEPLKGESYNELEGISIPSGINYRVFQAFDIPYRILKTKYAFSVFPYNWNVSDEGWNTQLYEIRKNISTLINNVIQESRESISEASLEQLGIDYKKEHASATHEDIENYKDEIKSETIEEIKDDELNLQNASIIDLLNNVWNYNCFREHPQLDQIRELLTPANSHLLVFYCCDQIFECLEAHKGVGLLKKYHDLSAINRINVELHSLLYAKYGAARDRQEKSLRRFKEAKMLARQYAKNSWVEEPTLRVGTLAKDLHHMFKNDLKTIGLSSPPAIQTIKGWIMNLAPDGVRSKAGRPRKTSGLLQK